MNKQEKLQLLEELVKEGRITLCEAFELSEPEKEYVYVPRTDWNTQPIWEPDKYDGLPTFTIGTNSARFSVSPGSTLTLFEGPTKL